MKTNSRGWWLFLLAGSLALPEARANQPVYGHHAMVVAQEPLAADVGLAVIKNGGNAVDAAVAVGFTLAVTYPFAGNIGGGGFMLVRMADGRTTFIDFRETAPARATPDMYDRIPDANASLKGWLASAVPGTVRGLEMAHTNFGTVPWRKLLEPAIRYASDGFEISHWQMESFCTNSAWLSQSDTPDSRRIFLKDGSLYQWGDRFRQPELAQTLRRIARYGARDFYEGETARLISDAMARQGGLITMRDLSDYRAVFREPLAVDYHGYKILTSPLPSSGGTCIAQMLGILTGSGYDLAGAGSAKSYHYLADAMRFSYADRDKFLGDSEAGRRAVQSLTNSTYLAACRANINPTKATSSRLLHPEVRAVHEGDNTTHFSIVDTQGNVVSVTYTLNNGYGSGVTVPHGGFLMNDEMNDFTTSTGPVGRPSLFGAIQSTNNWIEPGKRPLSSMAPTIVLKNGGPYLVLGAPGGTRIPSAVLQVILNTIDFHMNIQDAVDFPRVHAQWTDTRLDIERGVSPDTAGILTNLMGYVPDPRATPVIARVEAILILQGCLEGAHDGRGLGKAAGW